METAVIVILVIVALAAVGYFVARSRKPAVLDEGERLESLPRPDATAMPEAVAPKPAARPTVQDRPAVRVEEGSSTVHIADDIVAPVSTTPSGTPIETLSAEPAPLSEPAALPTPTSSMSVAASGIANAGPTTPRPAQTKKDLSALKRGLQQTRGGWVQRLVGLFSGKKELDPQLIEAIEETLITGDVGTKTTARLIGALKDRLGRSDPSNPEVVWSTLREVGRDIIDVKAPPFGSTAAGKAPLVILVVGVNGVGKTTTIGKLAARYKDEGKKVYLAAGDTFRAAAVAQLEAWGKRVGVLTVKGKDLSKPGAVVFDAVQKGAAEGADVVIADTAGRLHTKTPLMDELRKLRDAATKALPGAPHEILLVLDATTGQNGITQVREFREALDLTGIVLTKLDGTAKGGVILAICDEFKLPVRFVGVGEKVDDLREFNAEDFTQALFSPPADDDVEAA